MMAVLDRRKLRALRREKALTQEQLAEYSGISDRHMRNLETSEVNPSASVLCRISRALDTPMDDFMILLDDEKAGE